jgi:hypothetical protein
MSEIKAIGEWANNAELIADAAADLVTAQS